VFSSSSFFPLFFFSSWFCSNAAEGKFLIETFLGEEKLVISKKRKKKEEQNKKMT